MKVVEFRPQIITPKSSLILLFDSQTVLVRQIVKPKNVFRSIPNPSIKQLRKLLILKFVFNKFLLISCLLMPSDNHNSRTARAVDLISSLSNVALSQDVTSHQPQQLQCLHHGATFVPLCSPIFSSQPQIEDDLQWVHICNGFSARHNDHRGTSQSLYCYEASLTMLKIEVLWLSHM